MAEIALVESQVSEEGFGYSLGGPAAGQLVGPLIGPILGGLLADLTGSYRIPFYCTAAMIALTMALVWFAVHEEFTRPARGSFHRSTVSGLVALVTTPALLALFFVLLMAQFGVRTGKPAVPLYVKVRVGAVPHI